MEKDTSNLMLMHIAEKVLNEKGQEDIDELIAEGDIGTAKCYLLGGIDACYEGEVIFFEEAVELYRLLEMPPEEICKFRQENLGILYE